MKVCPITLGIICGFGYCFIIFLMYTLTCSRKLLLINSLILSDILRVDLKLFCLSQLPLHSSLMRDTLPTISMQFAKMGCVLFFGSENVSAAPAIMKGLKILVRSKHAASHPEPGRQAYTPSQTEAEFKQSAGCRSGLARPCRCLHPVCASLISRPRKLRRHPAPHPLSRDRRSLPS